MSAPTWDDLLDFEPGWGLRGDPHLWRELREQLRLGPVPPSLADLLTLYSSTYARLVGAPLSDDAYTYIERHAHGGMSSGHIDPETFRLRAWHEICERWRWI